LHVGLWLCCALAMAAFWADRKPHRHWQTRWWVGLYPPAFVALLVTLGLALKKDADRTLKGGVSLSRSFYGVLRVNEKSKDDPESHCFSLQHGRILHGNQYVSEERRRWPTTYYGRKSGVGVAIENLRRSGEGIRVGVVGLGTGTIAAYAQKGDYFRFYDINPDVLKLSGRRGLDCEAPYFTYLTDGHAAGADVEVVLGDARLSLERQEPQHFDVLALDAFTSDAIPIHLLTREAFEVYLNRQVKPDGVVAVHISNRYLDLEPVVFALADHFGYKAVVVESPSDKVKDLVYSATWVLVTKNEKFLACEPVREAIKEQEEAAEGELAEGKTPLLSRRVLWTDDYSNLVQVLKR